jgi:dihydroorotase
MKLLIRDAKIIDPKSSFHNTISDLLIVDGYIQEIELILKSRSNQEIKPDNLHLLQGWFDSSVSLGEPGFEDREPS